MKQLLEDWLSSSYYSQPASLSTWHTLFATPLFRQLRESGIWGWIGFYLKACLWYVHAVLQEMKEAIESGKRQTENTLKEGNDILDEASRLADEINSVIDVSI